jgi:catechol 2,3-dioxygenase-like lactoylglutathione lyase family enzyme
VRVTGLVFVGTRTSAHAEMVGFVRDVLGLVPADLPGVDADLFELADGSSFVVAPADEPGGERTVGFLVEDLDVAAAELRAARVDIDAEVAANERFRYIHFRAPDGQLYELVEVRSG